MTTVYQDRDLRADLQQLVNRMSTQKALAKKIGISPAYLNDILMGRRGLSPKVVKFLGYEKIVCYKVIQ